MKELFQSFAGFSNILAIVRVNLSGWYVLLALLLAAVFMNG